MLNLTVTDRLACAFLGAIFGILYGALLGAVAAWLTDGHFQVEYLWRTVGVFSLMGFVVGPYVGDIIGSVIHLVYGLFCGILTALSFTSGNAEVIDPEPQATGSLRSIFLVGLGTGIVLFFVWRTS